VWGELKRWETELGNELLVWEKGQSARLSEFGAKLMWAERRAQARLAPQIEALQSELERAFAVAFDPHAHVVTLYASHDHALGALREYALGGAAASAEQVHLDIRFCGSVDAIRALNEGRCELAGFHTLQAPAAGTLAERTYKPLLQPGLHKIIGFAKRMQGLMVAPGNPLALLSLQQVSDTQARFVNRALGTGTRVVLDELLAQNGLSAAQVQGYDKTEPSHAAAALAVASGQADVALGIEAAAVALGLDFVPLVQESYHLVCLKTALDQAAIAALRAVLRSPDWQQHLATTPGYAPAQCGEVQSLRQVLPWWSYARPKRATV
jgi:molybdate-binding protein